MVMVAGMAVITPPSAYTSNRLMVLAVPSLEGDGANSRPNLASGIAPRAAFSITFASFADSVFIVRLLRLPRR